MDTGIHVLRNVLTAQQCGRLREHYHTNLPGATGRDYNQQPVVGWYNVWKDPMAKSDMGYAVELALASARRLFKTPNEFVEAAFLCRMGVGHVHIPHYDNAKPDGSPNHTPQRTYSSLFYLNSDFAGGEIVFPRQNQVVRPEAGMLLMFPSCPPYLHEVLPVQHGARYSLPVWFTDRLKNLMRMD